MALKDTTKKMHATLEDLSKDLEKAEGGNKTAAQRVRTGTIQLAKLAKQYRKESVASEKKVRKKVARKKTKVTRKKVVRKRPKTTRRKTKR